MHDWSKLNNEKRAVLDIVIDSWKKLINATNTTEHDTHQFISDHASLFFWNSDAPVISRLRLGDDHITDLIVMRDNGSDGFTYELIELESPNDRTFTARGTQSTALTEALQQIEDWKRWISDNPSKAKELFPSKSFQLWDRARIRYTVIIGRREDSFAHIEKRRQKSDLYGVDIRSYGFLTDQLKRLRATNFPDFEVPQYDWKNSISEEDINKLINPFRKCLPYSKWKEITRAKEFYSSHMAGWNWKLFIEHTPINEEMLSAFAKHPDQA
ncbi:Shedu anti-phage system protein SduA domain-containing protein [Metapseudomonas otitidis]|uniref:Shedu anti-phage system protein SduA domain-containing protein n=1 Tax=Metapseudomonas otitidis TaxID=319939 RepID=UPI004055703F